MNSYAKLFGALVVGTIILVLCQTQLPSDTSAIWIVVPLIPGVVVLYKDRNLRGRILLLIGSVSLLAMIVILATAPLKDRTLTFWSALLDFFLVTVISLALYVGIVAVAGIMRDMKTRAADRREAEQAEAAAIQSELDGFVARVSAGNLPDETHNVTGVVLKPNERCCAYARNVDHVLNKKHTSYVGGSQGISFRIAKGVRYHVGAYKGHRVTTVDQVVSDNGSLYVTDKRVVFAGSAQVISVQLKQLGDVRVFSDGLALIQENKPQPLMFRFFPRAPVIAVAVRAMLDAHLQIGASSSLES
jgi:hypothetical protein